ncbi:ATP-binding protein [Paenibacillus sp. sgz302251]|uniref:ATP-binding protein n=1 Tax=Paenibacillus sp. sgz302251 TaxID=3414493 RepID=UPI003C7BA719
MSKLTLAFSQIPMKWKLTIWSSLLLFLLFAAYNAVQYIFVERWMANQEESNTRQDLREILNYLLEKELTFQGSELGQIRHFLEKVNENNQLIRVLDEQGQPLIIVSENIPVKWQQSYPASSLTAAGTWYLDEHLLLMRSPLTVFEFNGTIEIVKSIEEFDKLSSAFFQVMLICCLGAVVISGIGGGLLARQLLRPLQAMNETMLNIKEKGFHQRVSLNENNHDEITTLMKLFNDMMEKVERSFEQQKQFVEDASHELRTPVAIIEGHLAMLQRWGKDDPAVLTESLNASAQELARLKGLVEELLTLSRAEKEYENPHSEWPQAERTVNQVVKNFALLYSDFNIKAELHALSRTNLVISEQHLEQIMLIILDNAIKYSGQSKSILVTTEIDEQYAVIGVTDFGIGISEQHLPFVTHRLYRADKARSGESGGYGLGLAIAKRLMDRYGGKMIIESKEHEGTSVSLAFKIASRK